MTLLDSGVAMGWGTIHEVVGEFTGVETRPLKRGSPVDRCQMNANGSARVSVAIRVRNSNSGDSA